jgi:hypothetical protein
MSEEIKKIAVFDDRIIQKKMDYAVEQGASSVSNVPFTAISQATSQHSYQIQVPSLQTFLDKGINWTSTCFLKFNAAYTYSAQVSGAWTSTAVASNLVTLVFGASVTTVPYIAGQVVTISGLSGGNGLCNGQFQLQSVAFVASASVTLTYYSLGATAATGGTVVVTPNSLAPRINEPIVEFGKDIALSAFPLHSLVTTLQGTINDTTVITNTSDILYEVLRLSDSGYNRKQRGCPTYLDTYASYNDAATTSDNPIAGYENASDKASVPNGAFWNVQFTDANGVALTSTTGTYADGNGNTVTVNANGIPVYTTALGVANVGIFIKFTSTEKLMLSPFCWNDKQENSSAMFGLQNISVVLNMQNPSFTSTAGGRVLRNTSAYGAFLSSLAYNTAPTSGTFQGSKLDCIFLTPSLSVPLAPRSIVPYMSYPRYKNSYNFASVANGGTISNLQSQTLTLSQIPDLIVIYAKPKSTTGYATTDADWYFPINKISVNWNNYSGLMSSLTNFELFQVSTENGLEGIDWNQWNGQAVSRNASFPVSNAGGLYQSVSARQDTKLTGGFLVINPAKEGLLQSGEASGLLGNWNLQFNADFLNNSGAAVTDIDIYILTINSGFFESVKGSSRIVQNIVTQENILNADKEYSIGMSSLTRYIGGAVSNKINGCRKFMEKHMKMMNEPARPMPMGSGYDMEAEGGKKNKSLMHSMRGMGMNKRLF